MGVLGEKGWCFCSGGGGRSERVKGSIFAAKGPAIASIYALTGEDRNRRCGTGFMIHRGLLLTTHANIPSVAAAEAGYEIRLGFGRVAAQLVPQRFFITSSILDLTIVGLDLADSDSTPHYIKTGFTTTIDLGNTTYLLGHTKPRNDLTIDEGKVVISTDNLIKLSTDGVSFSAGSAGFDMHGNLAFMLCDPMKLATSPMCRAGNSAGAGSCAYSLSRKDLPMQFGIPVPVILDWLRQHWKGSLDEVSNPKLSLPLRLVSSGEVQCTAPKHDNGDSSSSNPRVQLLDINFPPRPVQTTVPAAPTSIFLPLPLKQLLSEGSNNNNCYKNDDTLSTSVGAVLGPSRVRDEPSPSRSEVESNQESNCSPVNSDLVHERCYDDGFASGDDETMYSAETMESRNIPSPRKTPNYNSRVNVGRSQSCVNGTRWSSPGSSGMINNSSNNRRPTLTKQTSLVSVRRTNSHTGTQRSHDFLSPTVSSAMKKRHSVEEQKPSRAKQVGNQGPSRWL
ncbi:Expressed protein 1 [Rhynchospora pubera]|uniref:Expressed protein 1 n=1 Tax=Rhynchospora pubera TaxID=906938 RepID=A0AAV8E1Y6_9POAL|nr:Expressed protein 1 [Rhynchospora pubera]KAJ4785850.1 Expressed protein 1 [Rhynchospora pubera]